MKTRNPEDQLRSRTRRGFLTMGAGVAIGSAAWWGLRSGEPEDGLPRMLRGVLRANESVSREYFGVNHRARQFPASKAATEPRENGSIGLGQDFSIDDWSLKVLGPAGHPGQILKLSDIQALPRIEQVTELYCIEGWTEIVRWGGARFSDFSAIYAGEWEKLPYLQLQTPDTEYFVGLDMASAMHPQTLLCYEINGRPLTSSHGAPLRLVIPVKYGIKNIKRIGTIAYRSSRPEDYWAQEGYDWYAGL